MSPTMIVRCSLLRAAVLLFFVVVPLKSRAADSPTGRGSELALRIRQLTPETHWLERPALALRFDAHHPQGLVRVGDTFYLSSVEVTRRPKALSPPKDGFDRDPGEGVGHLFRFDQTGQQTGDLILGQGSIYHPGGIDFDGQCIWVPVAEYRPRSRSKIYRIHLNPLGSTEIFSFADHIGAVAFDPAARVLHGMSWGSRDFYAWRVPEIGAITDALVGPGILRRRNPSFYIDYQDCHWIGDGQMICGGLRSRPGRPGAGGEDSVGGIELVEADVPQPVFQLPVDRRNPSGRVLTQNAFWVELSLDGLRFWFVPDDGRSLVRIFDVPLSNAKTSDRPSLGR